jgi:hypothetical protein
MTRLGLYWKGSYTFKTAPPPSTVCRQLMVQPKGTNTWILIDWTTQKSGCESMMTARGRARHQHQRTFSPTFFFWKIIIKKELGISCCARAYEIHYNTRMKEGEKKKENRRHFPPPFSSSFLVFTRETLGPCIHSHNAGNPTIFSPVFIHLFEHRQRDLFGDAPLIVRYPERMASLTSRSDFIFVCIPLSQPLHSLHAQTMYGCVCM